MEGCFSADPQPQGLWVGRWAATNVLTTLTGSAPAAVGDLDATDSTFVLDGNTVTTDLSSAATYTAIAAAIQARIQAISGGNYARDTFTHDGSRFVYRKSTVGDTITGGRFTDTASASDTDIADDLGMGPESTPNYVQGSARELVRAGLIEMLGLTTGPGQPIAVMLASDAPLTDPVNSDDTRAELAAYCQANSLIFAMLDTSSATLNTNNNTCLLYTSPSPRD